MKRYPVVFVHRRSVSSYERRCERALNTRASKHVGSFFVAVIEHAELTPERDIADNGEVTDCAARIFA